MGKKQKVGVGGHACGPGDRVMANANHLADGEIFKGDLGTLVGWEQVKRKVAGTDTTVRPRVRVRVRARG